MVSFDRGRRRSSRADAARRLDRGISELLGLAKGVLIDGEVSAAEALAIDAWLIGHPDVAETWPGLIIGERLARIFADGRVEPEERDDLADLLRGLVSEETRVLVGDHLATDLPLNRPAPPIRFPDRTFVFVGRLAFGPRGECERRVLDLGGRCRVDLLDPVDYLVVGTFGDPDWRQAPYGPLLEEAVTRRERGAGLAIVGEDHWAEALDW